MSIQVYLLVTMIFLTPEDIVKEITYKARENIISEGLIFNEENLNLNILTEILTFEHSYVFDNFVTNIIPDIHKLDEPDMDNTIHYLEKQSTEYLILFNNFINNNGDFFHNGVFTISLIRNDDIDRIEPFLLNIIQNYRAIRILKRIRSRVKAFPLKNWYRLYLLTKTEAFVQWYYAPDNGGGKITKRKMELMYQ